MHSTYLHLPVDHTNHYRRWLTFAIAVAILACLTIIAYQVSKPTVVPAIPAKEAIVSLADHMGFALGFGAAGTPGFPNPFQRHDPQKGNHLKTNGKHILNALRGIERVLGRQTLRDFLRNRLKPREYEGLTTTLDDLVTQLENPNSSISQEFGEETRQAILEILKRTKYIE